MLKNKNNKLGTLIHGLFSTQAIDSSGEILEIEGIDCSSLDKDGVANFEHKSDQPSQIVGKVLSYKKIFKEEDCENEHQKYFFNKANKVPCLYGVICLFDKFDHSGAKDLVAMLKFDKALDKDDTRQVIGFSVEGSRLAHKGSTVEKCIARKIAISNFPCNKSCVAEILEPECDENEEATITLKDLRDAFKKSQDMELDLQKDEQEPGQVSGVKARFGNPKPNPTRLYTKQNVGSGEKPSAGKDWKPKQTLTPNQINDRTNLMNTRIQYQKPQKKLGSSIYKDPNTYKLDQMNNARKNIVKNIIDKKRLVTLSEKNVVKKEDIMKKREEILKTLSGEAWELQKNKEQLLDIVSKKMPESSEEERLAFAKTFSYIQMKKKEIQLENILEKMEKPKSNQ